MLEYAKGQTFLLSIILAVFWELFSIFICLVLFVIFSRYCWQLKMVAGLSAVVFGVLPVIANSICQHETVSSFYGANLSWIFDCCFIHILFASPLFIIVCSFKTAFLLIVSSVNPLTTMLACLHFVWSFENLVAGTWDSLLNLCHFVFHFLHSECQHAYT